jgi:hypothetical protein
MPQGLTVLAALRLGEEEPLGEVLRAIGNDIRGRNVRDAGGRPHIDFCRSRNIHFARFAILDDPDRGPNRKRLLFSSNYDGDLDAHLAELVEITTDMSAIWGHCEAYNGVDRFADFIRAHAHAPDAFYIAFRDETVQSIRRGIAIRRGLRQLVDAAPGLMAEVAATTGETPWIRAAPRLAEAATRRIVEVLAQVARAAPVVVDALQALARWGVANVLEGTMKITASLGRYPFFRFFNWITRNSLPPQKSAYSSVAVDNCPPWMPLAPGDEIPSVSAAVARSFQGRETQAAVARSLQGPETFREDVITQNQLTLVTVVEREQVRRVRAVMAAIDSFAKRLAPPGSLIGISTIHFVRWLLIDDGRRLVMLSDYDGSWESYIDEFAEMILSGLDAIWNTSLGFPPDGARDLPAFKRFLRSHQVPAEIFFSAYPDETVLNIVNNLTLAHALDDAGASRAATALQTL